MTDSRKNAQASRAKADEEVTASTGAAGGEEKNESDNALPQPTSAWLMSLLKRSMKLDRQDDWPEKYLEEVTVDGIVKYSQSDRCKNIITMAGAGISKSAGIPDFRSPGTGLYDNLQKYNLPNPQSIFDISYFKENPEPFIHLAKELWPGMFEPTPCHYVLRLLAEKGLLLKHFTQNIDTLERMAGLDGDKVIEAHGTFHTSHCVNDECIHEYSQEWIKEKIFAEIIPTCEKEGCGSLVKPELKKLLPGYTSTSGGRHPWFLMMVSGQGFAFDAENNYRDVFFKSTCDDGCMALADKLGWGDELRKMIKTEHKKMDKEIAKRKEELKTLKERSTSAAVSADSGAKSSQVETDAQSTKDTKQTPPICDTKENATPKCDTKENATPKDREKLQKSYLCTCL